MRLVHVEEPEHTPEGNIKKAEVIRETRPHAILFEWPTEVGFSLSEFNVFRPDEKPKKWLESVKEDYAKSSERYPWLKTRHIMIEAIEELWKEGRQVYLFEIDGPGELTAAAEADVLHRGWLNPAWNYLREVYMHHNINKIEGRMEEGATGLVICHDMHWRNIQFLRGKPSKEQIWDHYFGSATLDEVEQSARANHVLSKHWTVRSHFASDDP